MPTTAPQKEKARARAPPWKACDSVANAALSCMAAPALDDPSDTVPGWVMVIVDDGRGLHSFFEMDDGSCLAFFEAPERPFEFKRQDTLDLHIALAVEPDVFDRMLDKARSKGVEVRGPVDHGFVRSIYMRDPNGYVVELTASTGIQQEIMDPSISKPREALARWQLAEAGHGHVEQGART